MLQEPIRRIRSDIGSHGLVHERLGVDHVSVGPAPIRRSHSTTRGRSRRNTVPENGRSASAGGAQVAKSPRCRFWSRYERANTITARRGCLVDRYGGDGPAKSRGSVPITDDHGGPRTASIESLSIEASGADCLQPEHRQRVLQPSHGDGPSDDEAAEAHDTERPLPKTILPEPFR